tara:strand:- start:7163 stop:7810 length:648 start_codon:yes stop_codon:yes gene_type:complete
MKKTLRYNYRLNPTPAQEAKLIEFGATARGIWNLLLSENRRRYEYDKTFLFYKDMASLLKEIKPFEEFEWIKAFDSAAGQQVARDLETAMKNAFSKGRLQRFPKHKISYKKKKLHNDSFRAVNTQLQRRQKGALLSRFTRRVPFNLMPWRKTPSSVRRYTPSVFSRHFCYLRPRLANIFGLLKVGCFFTRLTIAVKMRGVIGYDHILLFLSWLLL